MSACMLGLVHPRETGDLAGQYNHIYSYLPHITRQWAAQGAWTRIVKNVSIYRIGIRGKKWLWPIFSFYQHLQMFFIRGVPIHIANIVIQHIGNF